MGISRFEIISEGIISRQMVGTDKGVVCAPRCAITRTGRLLCTFIGQSGMGINDFKPLISFSSDEGNTWSTPKMIWPELADTYSIFGSISSSAEGELFFVGSRTPIEQKGESFWSEATQGLKQNEIIWSRSLDDGINWSEPKIIPMPIPGSAEIPGAMQKITTGRWICCYAPYNTFDPNLSVVKNSVICMYTDDEGNTWQHSKMITLPHEDSNGAETWVVELADGRLLATTWHIRPGKDEPNAFAISHDLGETWTNATSTEIMGQSTSLVSLNTGSAIFFYNQRKYGDIGVWAALVNPGDSDFGIITNQRIWATAKGSAKDGLTNPDNWTNFSFGEPSAVILNEDHLLAVIWTTDGIKSEIVYVKLQLK